MSKELSVRAQKVVELVNEIQLFKLKEFQILPKKLDSENIDKKINELEDLIDTFVYKKMQKEVDDWREEMKKMHEELKKQKNEKK